MQARQRPFCSNSSPDLGQLAVQAVRKSARLGPDAAGARRQGVAAVSAAGRDDLDMVAERPMQFPAGSWLCSMAGSIAL